MAVSAAACTTILVTTGASTDGSTFVSHSVDGIGDSRIMFVPAADHPEREDRADYLGVYCVETLECGHKVATYPQADALIAVRRDCKDCGSNVIEFPISKKAKRERAA